MIICINQSPDSAESGIEKKQQRPFKPNWLSAQKTWLGARTNLFILSVGDQK